MDNEYNMTQGATTTEKPYRIAEGGIQFRDESIQLIFTGRGIPICSAVAICDALNDAFVKGFTEGASVIINLPKPYISTKRPKRKHIDFFHAHKLAERIQE